MQRRADEVIAMVGLEEFRAYYPDQLSASMLQRVVIARAFAVLFKRADSGADQQTHQNQKGNWQSPAMAAGCDG